MPAAVTDAEREITSYHEAGHAVGYVSFGIPFRYVLVRRNPALGEDLGELQPLAHQAPPLRQAIVCLCGPVAEAVYTGRPLSELFETHCRSDLRMARDALARDDRGDPAIRIAGGRALRCANLLVEHQWSRIGTLARALLEHEFLDHADVLRALQQSKPNAGWSPPGGPIRAPWPISISPRGAGGGATTSCAARPATQCPPPLDQRRVSSRSA